MQAGQCDLIPTIRNLVAICIRYAGKISYEVVSLLSLSLSGSCSGSEYRTPAPENRETFARSTRTLIPALAAALLSGISHVV